MDMISGSIDLGKINENTTLYAVSLDIGRTLLTQVDEFVSNQSNFDRQARVKIREQTAVVTREMYLDYVRSSVMSWNEQTEIPALKNIVSGIKNYLSLGKIQLNLPPAVFLVKTDGTEEGYAAYTRNKDTIALPVNMIESITASNNYGDPLHASSDVKFLRDVIIHECFHLYSKNIANSARKTALYNLVHYSRTENNIALPNIPWPNKDSLRTMPEMKITNPDTPSDDVYIEMNVYENPLDPGSLVIRRKLTPILMANAPYDGGIFFNYLTWYFMVVEKNASGVWQAQLQNGRPILYDMGKNPGLMTQYMELIGQNLDGELFHPDEIMAQNWVFVANLPSMKLLEGMQQILQT